MQEMLAPFPDEQSTRDIKLIAETRGECMCKVGEILRAGTLAPDSWKLERFFGNRLISEASPRFHRRRGRRCQEWSGKHGRPWAGGEGREACLAGGAWHGNSPASLSSVLTGWVIPGAHAGMWVAFQNGEHGPAARAGALEREGAGRTSSLETKRNALDQ